MFLMVTSIDKTTITAHPSSLDRKKTTTYDIRNPGHDLRQVHKCDWIKPFDVIPIIPSSYMDLHWHYICKQASGALE
jgi:hypothetical protein